MVRPRQAHGVVFRLPSLLAPSVPMPVVFLLQGMQLSLVYHRPAGGGGELHGKNDRLMHPERKRRLVN
jgi:hypothetical protein